MLIQYIKHIIQEAVSHKSVEAIYEELYAYVDSDYTIHMNDIEKVGINPKTYSGMGGVYSLYLTKARLDNYLKDKTWEYFGERKYMNLLRIKPYASGVQADAHGKSGPKLRKQGYDYASQNYQVNDKLDKGVVVFLHGGAFEVVKTFLNPTYAKGHASNKKQRVKKAIDSKALQLIFNQLLNKLSADNPKFYSTLDFYIKNVSQINRNILDVLSKIKDETKLKAYINTLLERHFDINVLLIYVTDRINDDDYICVLVNQVKNPEKLYMLLYTTESINIKQCVANKIIELTSDLSTIEPHLLAYIAQYVHTDVKQRIYKVMRSKQ